MKYNHEKIEKKWQKEWEKKGIYQAKDNSKKKKFYSLVEFPFPSGEGLHTGHVRSYTAMDIISRKRRMEGFNVLYPIGWDAFGKQTEDYAIKQKIDPHIVVKRNTDNFRKQLKNLGLSYDWKREINTSDPEYYKWTQWMFIKFWENGLAYKEKTMINWCPFCKIGLANEEVINGRCERCEGETTKKEKEQWMIAITKYAEKLLEGLEEVDYPEKVKIQQRNWIGKSIGSSIKFPIFNHQGIKINEIDVFTTRADTIFGATFLVLAPESEIVKKLSDEIDNRESVKKYIKETEKISDIERTSEKKEKTGIEIKGICSENPVNKKKIPIFIADYVLSHYGSGAIMAVPAHDERDYHFAKKFNLEIIPVIRKEKDITEKKENFTENIEENEIYQGEGILINSGSFSGLDSKIAKEKITLYTGGKKTINYKLRDWVFSRQRYWGEPIPMVKCEKCGWQPVSEKELPVKLPKMKNYQPTETGESPLSLNKEWVKTKCPKCKGKAERETDTMPNWAGSSWYFLRYTDSKNKKNFSDKKKISYWMPVDWYNGGMEHTTLHLLYSRFWNRFLYDIKEINIKEPYKKRTSHGMILAEGGVKMSKSKGNVINPDDIVKQYGADTLRIYEMFMGPFEQSIAWDSKNILGARRFLEKVWNISEEKQISKKTKTSKNLKLKIEETCFKVSKDIENMKFNTVISSLMTIFNEIEKEKQIKKDDFEKILIILSPLAPHITEEIWQKLKNKSLIHLQKWPKTKKQIQKKEFNLIIQINGKVKENIKVKTDISQEKAEEISLKNEKIKKILKNQKIKKTIFIPNRLINFVV